MLQSLTQYLITYYTVHRHLERCVISAISSSVMSGTKDVKTKALHKVLRHCHVGTIGQCLIRHQFHLVKATIPYVSASLRCKSQTFSAMSLVVGVGSIQHSHYDDLLLA